VRKGIKEIKTEKGIKLSNASFKLINPSQINVSGIINFISDLG
jgi:hypothetical protein